MVLGFRKKSYILYKYCLIADKNGFMLDKNVFMSDTKWVY